MIDPLDWLLASEIELQESGAAYTDEAEEGGQLKTLSEITESELENSGGTSGGDVGDAVVSALIWVRFEEKNIRLGRDCGNSSGTDESGGDLDHFD